MRSFLSSLLTKGVRTSFTSDKTNEVNSLRDFAVDVATENMVSASRWAILSLLFFLQTSASLVTLSFGPLAPFLQEYFNISRAQVGLFTSLSFAETLSWVCFADGLLINFMSDVFFFWGRRYSAYLSSFCRKSIRFRLPWFALSWGEWAMRL